ncbi:hypothetical protein SLS53_000439 [Cytospora paraplurivora]|uniref:RRM domain-containing protein n=1 Tax=Cytospora paraplurivora TaxID=2898453 RepID=A0AAN9UXV0_9PEZI
MATTAMDYENPNGDRFEDEGPRYERDNRSASPRSDNGHDSTRRRSASPGGGDRDRDRSVHMKDDGGSRDGEGATNSGSNLFVTGIHPKLSEEEVTRLFSKYGNVEKCQIMRDPHTKESRGFGFVNFMTSEEADAAKEALQGKELEGRTLSIEKARRSRPRTPTPGKYFGPPKREPGGRGGGGGRFGGDRYGDDRRRGGGYGGGYGGGGGRYDDYRYRGYERRGYDDRGSDRAYRGGEDRGYREDRGGYDRGYDRGYREERGGYERRDRGDYDGGRIDRYASSGRDDRYSGGARGGGAGFDRYDRGGDRAPRDAPPATGGYSDTASRGDARDTYGGADRPLR